MIPRSVILNVARDTDDKMRRLLKEDLTPEQRNLVTNVMDNLQVLVRIEITGGSAAS